MLADVDELLNDYIEQEKLWQQEGERGVQNLEKIVAVLGYGNVEEFLLDNSGAIGAILEWIGTQSITEWKKKLTEVVDAPEEDKEDNE